MSGRSPTLTPLLALLLALPLALTGALPARGAEDAPVVVSLQDIDCQSCGESVAKLIARQEGIRAARFDRDKAEVTVERGAGAPAPERLLELVHTAGYQAVLGSGAGRYQAATEFPAGLDVAWISRAGEAVPIEEHLAPGKVTVVDFYAVWCGPCREVDAEMKRILAASDDVALRKVNVVDWSSPIAKQELANVGALPYVEVYGRGGKRVASITGLDLERLRKAIDKGRAQRPLRSDRSGRSDRSE